MLNLFKSKKKKFRAQCELSKTPIEKESAYLVTTAEIISSKNFWDNVMTEPDTMTYTTAYFKYGDQVAANMRQMIFNKYGTLDKPWIISDSQIHLFDIDESKAKLMADEWFEKEGDFVPEESKSSLDNLGENTVEELRVYAVKEAGRKMVQL